MKGNAYLLLTSVNKLSPATIYSRGSALKVKVYNLTQISFVADSDEIQLYAYHNEELLAFETIDIAADDVMELISAIKWYANYAGYIEMEILPDDPRIDHENEIAV